MMTREEAIAILQEKYDYCKSFYDLAARPKEDYAETAQYLQALQVALSALRPVSREQVEKVWRGEWITKHYVDGILEGTNFDECSKCGYQRVFENPELKTKYMFCPGCGRAMWDEAMQMLMERLEALKDGKD